MVMFHLPEDVVSKLDALDAANLDALALALKFGADKGQIQIARFAYRSALDHARRAFGLHHPDTLSVPQLPVATRYVFSDGESEQ